MSGFNLTVSVISAQAQTMIVCQYNRDWLYEKTMAIDYRRGTEHAEKKLLFLAWIQHRSIPGQACHELFAFDFIQATSRCSLNLALFLGRRSGYRLCFSLALVTRPLYLRLFSAPLREKKQNKPLTRACFPRIRKSTTTARSDHGSYMFME